MFSCTYMSDAGNVQGENRFSMFIHIVAALLLKFNIQNCFMSHYDTHFLVELPACNRLLCA